MVRGLLSRDDLDVAIRLTLAFDRPPLEAELLQLTFDEAYRIFLNELVEFLLVAPGTFVIVIAQLTGLGVDHDRIMPAREFEGEVSLDLLGVELDRLLASGKWNTQGRTSLGQNIQVFDGSTDRGNVRNKSPLVKWHEGFNGVIRRRPVPEDYRAISWSAAVAVAGSISGSSSSSASLRRSISSRMRASKRSLGTNLKPRRQTVFLAIWSNQNFQES